MEKVILRSTGNACIISPQNPHVVMISIKVVSSDGMNCCPCIPFTMSGISEGAGLARVSSITGFSSGASSEDSFSSSLNCSYCHQAQGLLFHS